MKVKSVKKVVYMVYKDGGDHKYWVVFDTKEDAVSCEGDGCKLYEAQPTYIGKYERSVKLARWK
jgi:hypothetical protein